MAGIDDIDCSNFFDQIDDLLDIPDEETCTDSCENVESDFFFDDFKDFPSIWTQSGSDVFHESNKSVFSENHSNSGSDLSDELPVPYEDIEQLEWLSNFVEDSFSAGNSLTIDVPNSAPITLVSPSPTQFQTTSPVSVLESSGCSYVRGKSVPVKKAAVVVVPSGARCGRARSERPRPPTFNRRVISPSTSFTMAGSSLDGVNDWNSECESLNDSSKIRKSNSNTEQKKKKKIKLSVPAEVDQNEDPNSLTPLDIDVVRKCQHCEITKTPQWRAGPNGPKTLCNACGVRYKSGRLFPEYRPAASPTFVPSIHSNSHKKVLEMRVKTTSCSVTLTDDSHLIQDSHTELMPNV